MLQSMAHCIHPEVVCHANLGTTRGIVLCMQLVCLTPDVVNRQDVELQQCMRDA